MKATYSKDTDSLFIEFRARDTAETRDLDENTMIDLDADGNICAITREHAQDRTDTSQFTLETVAA